MPHASRCRHVRVRSSYRARTRQPHSEHRGIRIDGLTWATTPSGPVSTDQTRTCGTWRTFRNIVVARMGGGAPGGVENRQDTPTFRAHLLPPSSVPAGPIFSVGGRLAAPQACAHEDVRRAKFLGLLASELLRLLFYGS